MVHAYINGTEVKIYAFRGEEALCYIPELDTKDWYKMSMIEVDHD